MKYFNLEVLMTEYQYWVINFGQGRNDKDLRFGQYIFNKFNVEQGNSYNTELAKDALDKLIQVFLR